MSLPDTIEFMVHGEEFSNYSNYFQPRIPTRTVAEHVASELGRQIFQAEIYAGGVIELESYPQGGIIMTALPTERWK
jgi:hypothetical protein